MKLKTVQPETSAAGIQIQGCGNLQADGRGRDEHEELPRRDRHVPRGALAVELLQEIVGDLAVQPVAQILGGLRPVVLARREIVRAGEAGGVGLALMEGSATRENPREMARPILTQRRRSAGGGFPAVC